LLEYFPKELNFKNTLKKIKKMNTTNTYKPSAHFKLITFEMIDKITALKIPKNEKFNFCRPSLAQAIINPLKVSYIKKDKIKSLKEHANINITLSPTPEQRNKYFNACSLEKFANHIFNKETISAEQLNEFNEIVKKAKEKANATLTKELRTFDAQQIPEIYNIKKDTDNETFNGLYIGKHNDINHSCMQGKPKKYFELYTDINKAQALEMATLTQGSEIVARALVWFDVPADKVDTDVIQPRDIYIDRIYTKTQEHKEETQTELYFQILKHYKVETGANKKINADTKIILPNCYNCFNIREKIKARLNTTKEIKMNNFILFDVDTNESEYNYYPYLDSLQWFDTYNQHLTADEEHGSSILKLDSTSGDASETHRSCEHCGSEMYEDEICYIETQEMEVCQGCAIYCEERDEYILTDDAVYNNHSGTYHYRGDLDI
jgi:ribosomal protein L32